MNGRSGQRRNRIAEAIDDFVKRGKDLVAKPQLAYFFPDLFNWVHFRSIWRNKEQTDIFWDMECACFMPGSSIAAEKNKVVWKLL